MTRTRECSRDHSRLAGRRGESVTPSSRLIESASGTSRGWARFQRRSSSRSTPWLFSEDGFHSRPSFRRWSTWSSQFFSLNSSGVATQRDKGSKGQRIEGESYFFPSDSLTLRSFVPLR